MNTTELKALAEAVKGWKLRDVLQTPDDKDEGIAFVGHQSDVGIFDDIVHIDTGNYMQPQMAIVIANYYAAANPAAMLALIADLESAQDERRALLATEQNLREELAECKAAYESQFKELHALKASIGEPVFWYRPVMGGEMYQGPHHNNSVGGRMMREEKPDAWVPLYAIKDNQP